MKGLDGQRRYLDKTCTHAGYIEESFRLGRNP